MGQRGLSGDTKRVAQSKDRITGLKLGDITEGKGVEGAAANADHGQVANRV